FECVLPKGLEFFLWVIGVTEGEVDDGEFFGGEQGIGSGHGRRPEVAHGGDEVAPAGRDFAGKVLKRVASGGGAEEVRRCGEVKLKRGQALGQLPGVRHEVLAGREKIRSPAEIDW